MRRTIIPIMIIVALVLNVGLVEAQKELSTVVIDAGHGGKDPGALGKKLKEKDLVLDVALRVGKLINEGFPEVKTIYTRKTDVFIPLDERAEIANHNGADLFISIHANWVKNTAISGSETFVLGLHRSKENLEVAQKENSVITFEDDYTSKYEGFDPTQPESYIIFELMQNTYLEQSISMASMVQDNFVNLRRGNRGVKQAGFLVLRQTSMPSILIELGFLSNAEEESYMLTEKGKAELAGAIYKAFEQYKNQFDGKTQQVVVGKNVPRDVAGVWFRVQYASSAKALDQVEQRFGEVYTYVEDGRYKYMVYKCSTYNEAAEKMKKVKEVYPDCFIVAFDNGEKTTVKAARKKTER